MFTGQMMKTSQLHSSHLISGFNLLKVQDQNDLVKFGKQGIMGKVHIDLVISLISF